MSKSSDFSIESSIKIISLSKKLAKIPQPKKIQVSKSSVKLENPKKELTESSSSLLNSRNISKLNIETKRLVKIATHAKKNPSIERDFLDFFSETSNNETNLEITNPSEENKFTLLKSVFENRPSTIFFDYPASVKIPKKNSRLFFTNQNLTLTYKISNNFRYPCILEILKNSGFTESSFNYNLNIEGVTKGRVFMNLLEYQKTNHFPGSSCLGRKDSMWKNIEKFQISYPNLYNFCPITYILPEDFRKFNIDRETNSKSFWILKPSNSACGKGIKVINKSSAIKICSGYIISNYIKSPHLINGFKYDLRVYVAVTSFNPLKIYIYKEGLVRFATIAYSKKKSDLKQKCMHLTNYSINKESFQFINNQDPDQDNYGSKWSFRALKEYYEANGINSRIIFNTIKDIVIKTLISAETHIYNKLQKYYCRNDACFELYGFDVLVDKNLKVWLLEVNIFPSLSLTSPLDSKIKYMLISDLYNLIGIVPNDKMEEVKNQRISNNSLFVFNKNTDINECLLSAKEIEILLRYEEEFYRKGEFERAFPNAENLEKYKPLFQEPRCGNFLLWKYIESDRTYLKRFYKKASNCSTV